MQQRSAQPQIVIPETLAQSLFSDMDGVIHFVKKSRENSRDSQDTFSQISKLVNQVSLHFKKLSEMTKDIKSLAKEVEKVETLIQSFVQLSQSYVTDNSTSGPNSDSDFALLHLHLHTLRYRVEEAFYWFDVLLALRENISKAEQQIRSREEQVAAKERQLYVTYQSVALLVLLLFSFSFISEQLKKTNSKKNG